MKHLFLSALLALTAGPACAADIYIGVERSKAPAWRLGLSTFFPKDPKRQADVEIGRKLREIVRADLLRSRYFDLIERTPGSGDSSPESWKRRGAGFLLEAKATHIKDEATLTVTVKDLASGDAMLSRYYRQNAKYWRVLAHRVSDDIVRQLTGRTGIALTRIAFVNDKSGSKELYLMDYDGARVRQITKNRSINIMPRWAPNGRTLAFTSYKDGNPDIFSLDLGRGSVRTLWDRQGLNLAGGYSPDGATLAATVTMGRSPKVHLISIKKGTSKRLTSGRGVESSPTYSPDGENIAFVTDRSGNPQIYTTELASGRTRRLSRLNWCDSPRWSPTGEWIVFAGRANPKDKFDIYLSDITGNRIVQLTHGEGSNEDPTWSPDGRFIAFSSNRDKRRKIYVMDRDGSAPYPLGELPSNSFTPSWGPTKK
jgi:TolB protein